MLGFDPIAGHTVADDVESSTIDKIIDFDGFEKYGPPAPTSHWFNFVNNFLGAASSLTPLPSQSFFEEWLTIGWGGNSPLCGLISGFGPTGEGTALAIFPAFGNPLSIYRNLPKPYSRIMIGFAFIANLGSTAQGVYIMDQSSGTAQCFIGVDNGGRILFNGASSLFASPSKVQPNTRHYLELDVTIHNTAGAYRVWLDGTLIGSGSNVNTRGGTSNNYTNRFLLQNGTNGYIAFDDMYWRDNTCGTATPFGDVSVKAMPVISDSSVQFTPGTILGSWYTQQTLSTNAPGANILILVPVTPATNMTVNSIGTLPRTTTTIANFKGVIYSDSSGVPGSLLSSGNEVTGCTSGVNLSLPLVTPQALTGGTQYWIGLITDTNIAFQLSDTLNGTGQSKANTYTGGAPAGPLSGMSLNLNPWAIWGVCVSSASNYPGVNKTLPPQSAGVMLTSNSSSTIGQEDLYNIQQLPLTSPSIYSVKVSANCQRSTTGPTRFISVRLKSAGVDDGGSGADQIPPVTPTWITTRFDLDPNTKSAWTVTNLNNAVVGYKLIS